MPEAQTEAVERGYEVGDAVKVKPGGVVITPDNTSHVVVGGRFYLDRAGTFLVEGKTVTVR